MSWKMFVVCVALSTAFRPLTPTAPAALELIVSQPAPSGTQLTVGIVGAAAAAWPRGPGARGDGSAIALSGRARVA